MTEETCLGRMGPIHHLTCGWHGSAKDLEPQVFHGITYAYACPKCGNPFPEEYTTPIESDLEEGRKRDVTQVIEETEKKFGLD